MLEVINARKDYGSLTAVKDLSFTIKPGEVFGLLGTNGAGKTTTFKMIMGLIEPTSGEVLFNNKPITYNEVDEIGYMIEDRSLLTKMVVKELIIHYGRLKSLEEEEIITRMRYWLKRFNIENYENRKINTLSKGNQQKIQFITAIINNPKLLILDEPFAGLDPLNTLKFVEVIRDFQSKGAMIIFSTHQIDHVESFCENLIVLQDGKPVIAGNINEIRSEYKKHNILINAAGLEEDKLRAISGVFDVVKDADQWIVKIEDEKYHEEVFKYVKTLKNVIKFDLEQARLSEIFIDKVGEVYE
ncbi:MAG: ATP-binding cassette domain-containing protein [Acholeplasmatales bacterium]|nr:ATP-binding cassette domain-containing protein [Acholeplasmataceae bacterium]MDY0115089.1 ATP-binding cassette domain-containing protein [Acholeplasmatales bacterium]MCK9233904.1 ATP-binding cassette domain-containing protein [Acholeplasmataceae bacterium]MCK9289159.1 ATP-binding cassette domain-containing protein [Acholeplasmataceae bacterium]MCK9427077.1 ATP-binding cassette domain-containing protein [Acholeplasmataceae bacterium]